MDLSKLSSITQLAGDLCYLFLALDALWGAYCAVVIWRRIRQSRFAGEAEQNKFLEQWEVSLAGDDLTAEPLAQADDRIVAQLGRLAADNRSLEPIKLRHLLADRFQRDFSSDLEYRMSWVNTVIKTAPMLGLFGTVLGMMSAFGKLGSGTKVDPTDLASDISLALITTAIGLAIAIPLSLAVASLTIQIRKMEDLVNYGLARMLDVLTLRAVASRRRG